MKKTALLFLIYALMVLIGGIIGHLTKGSYPSLIAGLVFGTLLTATSAWMWIKQTMPSLYLALFLTLLLDGFFTYRFIQTVSLFPSGIMFVLSHAALFLLVVQMKKELKKVAR